MTEVDISVWEATIQELHKQLTRYLATTVNSDWIQVHHSDIPSTDNSQSRSSSQLWPQRQYQIAFEIVFCQTPSHIIHSLHHSIQQDDLQFFVCLDPPPSSSSSSSRLLSKVFPRRRAPFLPPSLGDMPLNIIDWRATCLLNIILLTNYTLSVVKCKQEDLPSLLHILEQEQHGRESPPLPPPSSSSSSPSPSSSLVSIPKQVFPTPFKTTVNLDNSKNKVTSQPALIYPDIAFSVDDFHHAFSSIVLTNPDDCYCLISHAHMGPFSSSSSSGKAAVVVEQEAESIDISNNNNSSKVLLFSGFVGHSELEAVVGSQLRDPLRKIPIIGGGDTRKVVMKGPGGKGYAEVAVSADCEDDNRGSRGRGGVGGVVKMIANAAKLITEEDKVDVNMKLRCAVMSLIIDVEMIGLKLLGGERAESGGE